MTSSTFARSLLMTVATATLAHAQTPSHAPRVWAITAGIDVFEDRTVPPLPAAAGDARGVRDWLTRSGGWHAAQVLRLDSSSQRIHRGAADPLNDLYPSAANLDWALTQWLPARARRDDVILIYISGRVAPAGAGAAIVAADTRANDPDRTGWDVSRALDTIAAKGENPVVVWLDLRPLPKTPEPDTARLLNGVARWPSVAVWHFLDRTPADRPLRERSPFLKALLPALGTQEVPANLLGALGRLHKDPNLPRTAFHTRGGISPEITLWSKGLAAFSRPESELLLQQGHADRVLDVRLTPDSATILTSSADSTVRAWRASDRTLLRILATHTIGVTHTALSRDGRRLATGDGSGRIDFRRLSDYRLAEIRAARPHSAAIAALGFLDDARRAVSLDTDGRAALWTIDDTTAAPTPLKPTDCNALAVDEHRFALSALDDEGNARARVFDSTGREIAAFPGPGAAVVQGGLALQGDRLAVGDRRGVVVVYDTTRKEVTHRLDFGAAVTALRFTPKSLLVSAGDRLHLVKDGQKVEVPVDGRLAALDVSSDGTLLAATARDGSLHAWRFDEAGAAKSLSLEGTDGYSATSVVIAPDGRTIVAGGRSGDVRSWNAGDGKSAPAIPPHRGRITALAVSPDGRRLVVATRDRTAAIWDLAEGRGLLPIEGGVVAAAFLPDGRRLIVADARGEIVVIDAATGLRRETLFARPPAENGEGPSRWAFGRIAVAPDGKVIAAAAPEAPLAGVWLVEGGTPRKVLRTHDGGISAVGFLRDGAALFTAGVDGLVRIHPLDAAGGDSTTVLRVEDDPITAAVADPLDPRRLFTGHAEGRVIRWELTRGGEPKPTVLGRLEGAVRSLATGEDGRTLVASGDDKSVRLWSLADPNAPPFRLGPSFSERVTSVVAWPGGKLVAAGSEDTTIRLWRLSDRAHLGTLAASPDGTDWIAFTPDGRFDASPGAESLVTWLRDGRVMPLDQFFTRYRVFRLADRLRQAETPPLRFVYSPAEPPPSLALDTPAGSTVDREIPLTLTVDDPAAKDMRLYRDGVPVRVDVDFVEQQPGRRVVRAALKHGINRFYAMAARADGASIEGRSNVVEIRCDAPDRVGRLHVLALGVDSYKTRPLKFSVRDAEIVAQRLKAQGVETKPDASLVHVLRNGEVDEANVRRALGEIRREAKPEDTVVVFLAGHAAVRADRSGRERFCLLLPSFPLPPLPTPDASGLVASRGDDLPKGDDPAGTVLPFSLIEQYLVRIDAQQRLVVLDACQAEAALDDPTVRRIRERIADKVDEDAHLARTSYILASRRDEPAFEVEALGHGLLTHVLLRGMASPGLQPEPGRPLPPSADLDRNRLVTTLELRRYVDVNLPELADRYLDLARRGVDGRAPAPVPPAFAPRPPAVQGAEGGDFPLVRTPGD